MKLIIVLVLLVGVTIGEEEIKLNVKEGVLTTIVEPLDAIIKNLLSHLQKIIPVAQGLSAEVAESVAALLQLSKNMIETTIVENSDDLKTLMDNLEMNFETIIENLESDKSILSHEITKLVKAGFAAFTTAAEKIKEDLKNQK